MNPWLMALLGLGAPAVGAAAGSLFGGNNYGQAQQLGNNLFSPKMMMALFNQLYPQMLQNPAFSTAKNSVLTGASAAGNAADSSLASRGISGSGIGAVTRGVQAGTLGRGMADLHSQFASMTMQQVMNMLQGRAGLLGSIGGQPNPAGQGFAAGLGSLPYLFQNMPKAQQPAKPPTAAVRNVPPDPWSW